MQRRAERISVSRGKNVSKTGISRAVSKWSHEKPTVAGWYWYRGPLLSDPDDEPIVVKVYDVGKLFYAGTWGWPNVGPGGARLRGVVRADWAAEVIDEPFFPIQGAAEAVFLEPSRRFSREYCKHHRYPSGILPRRQDNPELVYGVLSGRIVLVESARPSDLKLEYKGRTIATDVVLMQLAIWNRGRASIKPENVLSPLEIRLKPAREILKVSLGKKSRDIIGLSTTTSPEMLNQGRVAVGFKILENGDGSNVQIIFAGPRETEAEVIGTIEGQGRHAVFTRQNQSIY